MQKGLASLVFVSVLACLVMPACGGGGGGGSSPVAPPPPPPVQIAGNWNGGTCTTAGMQGSGCFAREIRSLKGIPFAANIIVTQSGGSVTIDIRVLGASEVFEGTIDSNGNIVADQPDSEHGSFVTTCGFNAYTVHELEGRLTGTATASRMDLRFVQEGTVTQLGVLITKWKWIKDIAISR